MNAHPIRCSADALEAHLHSLIAYFSAHPLLASVAVFAAALLEALAVVGTFIPGSSVVFAGGVLVGLRVLDPWLTAALAIAGAILGDGVSYWLGNQYRESIRATWLIRRHPALFDRGHAYFIANGGKSVFLGRFLGPLRAIVPVIAGMSGMPARRFYAMNVVSAVAWAVAHLLPGVMFGASLQLAGAVSTRLVALVAVLAVGLWLTAQVIGAMARWGMPYLRRLRDRSLLRARTSRGPVAPMVLALLDPARRETLPLMLSATMLVAGTWLFLGIVEDVVNNDTLVQVDKSIFDGLQGLRTAWIDDFMVTVTQLAGGYVMASVVAIVSVWFALTRRFRTLGYWIAAAAFAQVIVLALKYALGRARPSTGYAAVDEFSFPSGHAMQSMVVFGFLAFLLGHRKPGWQQAIFAFVAAAIALLVGFSRLYLGAHWFSDVVASYGLGIAWIALLSIAYIHHFHERAIRATPVVMIVVAVLAFVGGSYASDHHDRDVARYAKPDVSAAIDLNAWRAGGWRELPAARSEIGGGEQEPFAIQWVASREKVMEALAAAGFVSPVKWRSPAALLWLLPSTPIDQLPVLPKLNRGEPPAVTAWRGIDQRTRSVVRLWRVESAFDHRAPSRTLPLWAGMITTERAEERWGLMTVTRTRRDVARRQQILAQLARGSQVALVEQSPAAGDDVWLVW